MDKDEIIATLEAACRKLEAERDAARAHFWRACCRWAAEVCADAGELNLTARAESIRAEIMAEVNKERNQ